MSIDMKQFHSVFFEESQEHLDEMEHLLLDLDVQNPDAEQLNTIFRAAHSIKGGAGIFGFDGLVSVTHVMESLLDKIRQGKMGITSELVDLFLASVDVLKGILTSYRNNTEIDWAAANRLTELLEAATDEKPKSKKSKKADEGFGFFTDPIVNKSQETYGFFEDDSQSEAYGFFEDIDKKQQEAYGFFDEAPVASTDAPTSGAAESGVAENPAQPQPSPVVSTAPALTAVATNKAVKPTESSAESTSIRVDVAKVDQLINLVGEIVITQSMMSLLGKSLEGPMAEKFQAVANELERNTREIQEAVMSIRMLPVSFVFNRFPRVVRDLSSKLGKQIDLIIEGGDTELDKGLTEKLVDPLTHLVRNSIDHGIESPEKRRECGKEPTGVILVEALRTNDGLTVTVQDDGHGIDLQRVAAHALKRNLYTEDQISRMSEDELISIIFQPGFSTAAVVSSISGRGVGMDMVKNTVESVGGRLSVTSVLGQGSKFILEFHGKNSVIYFE